MTSNGPSVSKEAPYNDTDMINAMNNDIPPQVALLNDIANNKNSHQNSTNQTKSHNNRRIEYDKP
jgi:hypothetical protein